MSKAVKQSRVNMVSKNTNRYQVLAAGDPEEPQQGLQDPPRPSIIDPGEGTSTGPAPKRAEDVPENHMEQVAATIRNWGDEADVLMPMALQHLTGTGAVFKITPVATWNVMGGSAKLRKNLSASFSLDINCSSEDILQGLVKGGVIAKSVTAIQRKSSTKSWVVAFETVLAKNHALEIGRFEICGCPVHISDVAASHLIVKIYEAPPEMPDTVVIGRLSAYGRVISFRRDRAPAGVENGIRMARMNLRRAIPSSVRLAGENLRIWYPG